MSVVYKIRKLRHSKVNSLPLGSLESAPSQLCSLPVDAAVLSGTGFHSEGPWEGGISKSGQEPTILTSYTPGAEHRVEKMPEVRLVVFTGNSGKELMAYRISGRSRSPQEMERVGLLWMRWR